MLALGRDLTCRVTSEREGEIVPVGAHRRDAAGAVPLTPRRELGRVVRRDRRGRGAVLEPERDAELRDLRERSDHRPAQGLDGACADARHGGPVLGHQRLEGRDVGGVDAAILERTLAGSLRLLVSPEVVEQRRIDEHPDPVEQEPPGRRGSLRQLELPGVEAHHGGADREGGERRRALVVDLRFAAPPTQGDPLLPRALWAICLREGRAHEGLGRAVVHELFHARRAEALRRRGEVDRLEEPGLPLAVVARDDDDAAPGPERERDPREVAERGGRERAQRERGGHVGGQIRIGMITAR